VPPALKLGGEESVEDAGRLVGLDLGAGETKHIGVIVPPGERRGCFIVNQGGAHAGNLVGGDAHADAGGAHQDAESALALRNAPAHLLGIIGVIHR